MLKFLARLPMLVIAFCLVLVVADASAQTSDPADSAPNPPDATFPAPQGGSYPVRIEPEELTQPERDIVGYGDPILAFSLRSRSAVQLNAAVESQTMLRMAADAGTVLNEATFPGIERNRMVGQPIPTAYCTPEGALRDMWGNRRWRACFVDINNDNIFDKWLDVACAANEVSGCNDVPALTMIVALPILNDLRTPVAYGVLPDLSAPTYPMALVVSRSRDGLELTAVDRTSASSPRTLSRRDLAGIPADGLSLSAYGAQIVVTRTDQGGLHVRVVENVSRQLGYVQTTVSGFPQRVQQRTILVATTQ